MDQYASMKSNTLENAWNGRNSQSLFCKYSLPDWCKDKMQDVSLTPDKVLNSLVYEHLFVSSYIRVIQTVENGRIFYGY